MTNRSPDGAKRNPGNGSLRSNMPATVRTVVLCVCFDREQPWAEGQEGRDGPGTEVPTVLPAVTGKIDYAYA
jgi:hypothetical protein